jgi:hypothetical protein
VLSPFLASSPTSDLRPVRLRIAALVVLGASVAVWIFTAGRELWIAYHFAGPSVFSSVDRRQFATVREAVPEKAPLLLVAESGNAWQARLWQRAFFPRNAVLVVYQPYGEGARTLRKSYGIRYAVLIGPPPYDPGFRWSRDLGPIAGMSAHVIFGELEQ